MGVVFQELRGGEFAFQTKRKSVIGYELFCETACMCFYV